MVTGVVVLILSVYFLYISNGSAVRPGATSLFHIAPPFAVVFLLGLLWRRANGTAAIVTIVSGSFSVVAQKGIAFAHSAQGRDPVAHAV